MASRRRRDRRTTRSSSVAATTGSSTAAYLGKAGLRTVVLERRETARRRGRHVRARARGTRPDARPHRRAAAAVGRPRPRPQRHGLSLVGPDVRVFAPGPDGGAVMLWGDVAKTAEGLRARSAADADATRPSTGWSGRCRASSPSSPAQTPPDIAVARARRRAGRAASRAHVPRPRARRLPDDHPRPADGRSRTSWPSRSRPTRSGRPSPGAASGTRRWARGRPARPRSCSRRGRQRRRGGRPDGLRARRSGRARRRARRRRRARPASRSAPAPRSSRITSTRRPGDRRRARVGRGDRRAGRRRRHRPEADPDAAGRPGRGRPEPALARRQHPDARHGRQGQPRPRGLPRFTAAGDDDAAAPRPDRRRARDRRHGAGARCGQVRPAVRRSRCMEATIPSLADPSLVDGAAPGHARHERHRPVRRRTRLRDGTWDDGARGVRRPRRRDARRLAPGLAGLVTARQVLTPLDLERDYGLTGGHPMHGEHGLDQFFLWRPLLGHARYRLALDGLYLCGSGAHPGGGDHRAARPERGARDRRRPAEAPPLTSAPESAPPTVDVVLQGRCARPVPAWGQPRQDACQRFAEPAAHGPAMTGGLDEGPSRQWGTTGDRLAIVAPGVTRLGE